MQYIDLTHIFSANTPPFPGDPAPELKETSSLNKDGYLAHQLKTDLHAGTHMDAPAHFIKGGKMISDYRPEKFFGRGVLVDARGKEKIGIDLFIGQDIAPGDVVLILTGWDKKFHEPDYFNNYPALTLEFVTRLVELKASIIGFDTPSPDHSPYELHAPLLENDILIIEDLTNLEALLPSQNFEIIALPAKFAAEAAPCRVVAKIL